MDTSPRHDDQPTGRPGQWLPPRRRRTAIVGTVAGLVAIGSAGGIMAGLERPAPPTISASAAPRPAHGGPGDHRARNVVDDVVLGVPASSTTPTVAGGRSRSDVVVPGAAPFPHTASPITAVFT
ncbi:hypothetical protein LQ327_25700 [Actinomycetospora endophytica]|uniref:Uncharacterized protein n=1 Tax=Actinomycetospora endophytica TaxID=2291215 RepID=A0ABS8PES3_9PSEU|nr:hypothetical protein [Actinomycetospora endophytica]MCD2196770.1 hypothetical protein [Actinomycetospora endophytica]